MAAIRRARTAVKEASSAAGADGERGAGWRSPMFSPHVGPQGRLP